MVPAAIVCREDLPLTPNGKIDRSALPPPESPTPSAAISASLATDLERTIAAVWREALGTEHVGADDNFFELGGHSLLLATVHSRLKGVLPHDVSMVDLFRYPTIRSLANHLEVSEPSDAFMSAIQARVGKQRDRQRQRPPVRRTEGGEAR
jgi:hypothetical protein